jgi:hypothetical protein
MGYKSYEKLNSDAKYKGLKPLVLNKKWGDKITPQEHFEALLGGSLNPAGASSNSSEPNTPEAKLVELFNNAIGKGKEVPVAQNQTGGSVTNKIINGPKFIVEEMKYPGNELKPPVGQFVYVFTLINNALVLEALCGKEGWIENRSIKSAEVVWFYRDGTKNDFLKPIIPSNSKTYNASSKRFLPDPLKSGNDEVVFFLSSVQLNKKSIEIVQKNLTQAAVKPGLIIKQGGYVAIPEPMEWASQANKEWLIPKADKHQNHLPILNEDLFIAEVAEEFHKTGYQKKVHMGEWYQEDCKFPTYQVKEYIRQNSQDLVDASNYVRLMIDSPQHRAVEAACTKDKLACAWMLQHWSDVIPPMVCTDKGREFVSQLAQGIEAGKDRSPQTLVSNQSSPSSPTFFENLWAGNALTIASLFLSLYTDDTVRNPKISGQDLKKAKTDLEKVSQDFQLPLALKKYVGHLQSVIGGVLNFKTLLDTTDEVKKAHKAYADSSFRLGNFLDEFKVIGVYTNAGQAVTSQLQEFLKDKGKPALYVKRLTGFLMLATALGDATKVGKNAAKAYQDSPGKGVLALGVGIAGTAGGAMTGLAYLCSASAALGVESAAGYMVFALNPYFLVGSALCVLMSQWLFRDEDKDSVYEQFLWRCRFGKKHQNTLSTEWSQEDLGTKFREFELKTAIGMLCGFKVTNSINRLTIFPGLMPDDSYFEVVIDYTYQKPNYFNSKKDLIKRVADGNSGSFVIKIKEKHEAILIHKDGDITYSSHVISKNGRVDEVKIRAIDTAIRPHQDCKIRWAYIRLIVNKQIQVPPKRSGWLRASAPTPKIVTPLDPLIFYDDSNASDSLNSFEVKKYRKPSGGHFF